MSTPKSDDHKAKISASVRKTLARKNRRIRRALAVLDQLEKNGVVLLNDDEGRQR